LNMTQSYGCRTFIDHMPILEIEIITIYESLIDIVNRSFVVTQLHSQGLRDMYNL